MLIGFFAMARANRHTHTQTQGDGNSMTDPAQRAESMKHRDLGKKFSGH